MPASALATIWIECAMATVMTIIGKPELAGPNTVPIHPAKPTVLFRMNTRTTRLATVPHTERNRVAATTAMIRNTIGASLRKSSCVVSAKARFITTSPVR